MKFVIVRQNEPYESHVGKVIIPLPFFLIDKKVGEFGPRLDEAYIFNTKKQAMNTMARLLKFLGDRPLGQPPLTLGILIYGEVFISIYKE